MAEQAPIQEPFKRLSVDEARPLIESGEYEVIDVREPDEYAREHIPGVKLVPLRQFLANPHKYVTRDKVIFVCQVGQRSAVAAEMAAAIGVFEVINLEGGTEAWRNKGYPIER
jgi:adenylyltransferase/sulfurtransferase